MQIWKVILTTNNVDASEESLSHAGAGAVFITDSGNQKHIEAYFQTQPDLNRLEEVLPPHQNLAAEILPPLDWVSHSQTGLPVINQPPFFIFETLNRPERPNGLINIELQAGRAFGSGHHETTRGCLMMLDKLLKRTQPKHILDLGCGSGILAIALAKATHQKIKASDIDPEAINMTLRNSCLNHVRQLIKVYESDGFNRLNNHQKSYDLIVANILTGTLKRLANELTQKLAPARYPNAGGSLVLSGILNTQQQQIVATMRQFGLRLQEKVILEEWTTLCFRR